MSKNTKTLQVRLSPQDWDNLRKAADRAGLGMSEYVRRAIDMKRMLDASVFKDSDA